MASSFSVLEHIPALLIGILIGMLSQYGYAFFSDQRASRLTDVSMHKEHIKKVSDSYEVLISQIIKMQRGEGPDASILASAQATLALHGSPSVQKLFNQFLEGSSDDRKNFKVDALVDAMHQHTAELLVDSP